MKVSHPTLNILGPTRLNQTGKLWVFEAIALHAKNQEYNQVVLQQRMKCYGVPDVLFVPQNDLIVLNDVHRVFAIDALASSHPLSSKEEEIQRPEQISEVFDAISYSKVRCLHCLLMMTVISLIV